MNLNPAEVNNYLQLFLPRNEDAFQEAWLKILESQPQALEEITPIAKRVRSTEISRYLKRKYKEISLNTPVGKDGDEKFTLESILKSPETEDPEDKENGNNGLYKKIVDFIIGEYMRQKNENIELKRRDFELKTERLRLGRDRLNFKKIRFESWKKVMEDKTKQKESHFRLQFQLEREKLEFEKNRFYFKEQKRTQRTVKRR